MMHFIYPVGGTMSCLKINQTLSTLPPFYHSPSGYELKAGEKKIAIA